MGMFNQIHIWRQVDLTNSYLFSSVTLRGNTNGGLNESVVCSPKDTYDSDFLTAHVEYVDGVKKALPMIFECPKALNANQVTIHSQENTYLPLAELELHYAA